MRYSDKQIEEAVKHSKTNIDVLKYLKASLTSGGTYNNIVYRIKKLKLDTSHFYTKSDNVNQRQRGLKKANPPDKVLIFRKYGLRSKAHILRKALIQVGVKYECLQCGISKWRDTILKLEIDHINGNPLDNRKDNLRFLCPNCHSQSKIIRK